MNTDKAQEKYHMLRDEFSTDELEEELERRKKKENSKPVMVEEPDLRGLKADCQSIIDDIANGDYYEDNDDARYIYEDAMVAFFGKDIFKWINENT